ncbi:MAG: PH domain-containing protein [Clostridiales bacterium]|jgi:hypothetical protein|nr:PH domain-containing protein [Clostridiales bacterium]
MGINDKIKLKNRKEINAIAIAAAVALAGAAVAVVALYRLSGGIGAAIASGGILLLLSGGLIFSVFYSYYVFKDDRLTFYFGPFAFKIAYADMRLLRQSKDSGELFLIYLKNENPDDARCVRVLIDRQKNDGFVQAVRNKNGSVVFEIFDKKTEDTQE